MTDNSAQIDYWNTEAGATWAAEAEALDRMLEPLGRLALDALAVQAGERVLDIGCGAGATSRALAAAGAAVTGVDVSGPLLAVARAKGGGPAYLLADAGADPLPGPFDAAFSRFGVMFFTAPEAAFAHVRAAMAPGGRIAFVCWGPMAENAWAMEPLMAALPHLPEPPKPAPPGAPGPFAFGEPGRAVSVLEAAGWRDVTAQAWRGPYVVGAADVEAALPLMLKIGPLGAMLRQQPQAAAAVTGALRDVLAKRVTPQGIAFPASVWVVTARA